MASSLLYVLVPVGALGAIYLIRKLREYQWGWISNKDSLKDKVYIVTGSNTGLGEATTKALVARHATVIMACRNIDRANEAIARIRRTVADGTLVNVHLEGKSKYNVYYDSFLISDPPGAGPCFIRVDQQIRRLNQKQIPEVRLSDK